MLDSSNCSSANNPSDYPARSQDPASRHVSCDIDDPPVPRVMNPPPHSRNGPSGREDDATALNSTRDSDTSSTDRFTSPNMTSEIDRRLHDVGVAALAAVSQYPRAVDNAHGDLMVSEVVNAVTSAGGPPDYGNLDSGVSLLPGHRGRFQQSAMGGTPSAGPGFAFGSNPSGDVDMETIVRDLLHRTGGRQNIAIAPDSDFEEAQKDMVMDYESATMEDKPSPSSTSDDELRDFLRFYPDEEEYYYQREARPTQEAEMPDCDLDDFYNSISYDDIDVDLPQTIGLSITEPLGNYTEDQMDFGGPHPASIIHTSSKVL
jgi:hypothetical protein